MPIDFRIACGWFNNEPKRGHLRSLVSDAGEICWFALQAKCRLSRPDGDLSGWSALNIEYGAGWAGQPGAFYDALCQSGLLDGEPGAHRMHDFAEINPYSANQASRTRAAKVGAHARYAKERGCVGGTDLCGRHCDSHAAALPSHADSNAPAPAPPPVPSPSPDPSPPIAAGGGALLIPDLRRLENLGLSRWGELDADAHTILEQTIIEGGAITLAELDTALESEAKSWKYVAQGIVWRRAGHNGEPKTEEHSKALERERKPARQATPPGPVAFETGGEIARRIHDGL